MGKTLDLCIENLKKLPLYKQRCVAAIVGAQVADAATRPLHWIYKQDVLDAALSSVDVPEFYPESKSPYYEVELGATSNYNDILRCTLKFMYSNPESSSSSSSSIDKLGNAFKKMFGPGTPAYELTKCRDNLPVKGVWLHNCIIQFVQALHEGRKPVNEEEHTMDANLAALPLILVHDVDKVWNEMKNVITLFTQHSQAIVYFHAFNILLLECIAGTRDPFIAFKEKLQKIHPELIEQVVSVESTSQDFITTVKENGKACYIPGTFLGAYLAMKKSSSFKESVRLNITSGGCNCSRANLIGACFGALYGIEGIPHDWMERVNGIEETMEMAISIAQR